LKAQVNVDLMPDHVSMYTSVVEVVVVVVDGGGGGGGLLFFRIHVKGII
jgi:hypothetical protein